MAVSLTSSTIDLPSKVQTLVVVEATEMMDLGKFIGSDGDGEVEDWHSSNGMKELGREQTHIHKDGNETIG